MRAHRYKVMDQVRGEVKHRVSVIVKVFVVLNMVVKNSDFFYFDIFMWL